MLTKAISDWEKQHAAGEEKLAGVLSKFFADQTSRILAGFDDAGEITIAAIPSFFDAGAESKKLLEVLTDPVVALMAAGAATKLAAPAGKKKKAIEIEQLTNFELPADVKASIVTSFNELEGQSYWQEIQSATSEHLTSIINDGINEGLTGPKLAQRIQDALGDLSDVRSTAIARTETTMAYNAGHQSAYDSLDAAGEIEGKQWASINGPRTREDHAAADGQIVGVNEDFTVGGYPARFPGDWSLPAEERVNCRCSTIAKFPTE